MDFFAELSLTTKIILLLSLILTMVVSVTFIVASIALVTTAWPVISVIALGIFVISLDYH